MIVAGVVCLGFSVILTGAGHGWYPPIYVSWIALPAGVVAVAAAKGRHSVTSLVFLIVLAIIAFVCDLFLSGHLDLYVVFGVGSTDDVYEGAGHAWDMVPLWMGTWLATWAAWQLVTVAAIVARFWPRGATPSRRSPPPRPSGFRRRVDTRPDR